ncbi:MAG: MucB/RseB C-terminal domain-containing protein [Pseudomonadota bacterium]|nr:MucB/RseB C-terminal domain-containing protein [Pseudomonadota bacterium]
MISRQVGLLAGGAFAALLALPAQAADPLAANEAAAWLQRISDAARRVTYEGVFVVQHGAAMQTLSVTNHPVGASKDSRLAAMDGIQREVRCTQSGSISRVTEGGQVRMEKRLNSRHFPDLLPPNAAALANWYGVKLGEWARVAGLECRQVEILPKDAYRWGYVLCADKDSGLPLKAVMVNEAGRPLMQYAFAEIRIGGAPKAESQSSLDAWRMPVLPASMRPIGIETVSVKVLPPGFSRITAVKRTLPNMSGEARKPGEVEHWVFSDGLTHISLFLEPATHPIASVRGQSKQGMINMVTRQVGTLQATILGDAPWAAIEAIAMGLEARTDAGEIRGEAR